LVESTAARRESATGKEEFILYLGSIEEKKGIIVLLDAYSILRNRLDVRCPKLILAGGVGGKAFDLESAVRARGLQSFVQHLGHVPDQRKVDLLRSATVFVFPSYYEGFGIPPLEAMACGAPVVAARSTSIPEVLGDAAVYFAPGDAEGLAMAVEGIVANDSLRSRLSELGRTRAGKYRFSDETGQIIEEFAKFC